MIVISGLTGLDTALCQEFLLRDALQAEGASVISDGSIRLSKLPSSHFT
jgi:hypothetical protein